ncbi:glycosyltransferase family 2 protein [Hymenobacter bucti]|uniref:Glycosyltransferase family 2 protein n=1 Tax=Hymenobacter bucti TaxID=1844114 RepID=A0ABW4QRX3_9BACT
MLNKPDMMVNTTPISSQPLVTVLMGVYNAATYLREAIDSIINQTFTNFEFLIYNDGSTDATAEIVRSYTDPRIFFFDNPINRSVSPNMNEGIERAQGRYIVRMDGDDIADPERLAKQVAYMEAHPEIGLCGSAVRYFGASNALIQMPENNDTIQHTMWLQNSFYQPSVIIRTSVLLESRLRYDVRYEFAEDYKLWSDMCAVTQVHNLPEPLLNYRIHPHQISRRQSLSQQQVSAQIRKEQMNRLHIHLRPEQEGAFGLLTIDDGWRDLEPTDYREIATLLDDLGAQAQHLVIATDVVNRVMAQQWGRILGAARQFRPALVPFILRQPMCNHLPIMLVTKLLMKCLIRWKIAD